MNRWMRALRAAANWVLDQLYPEAVSCLCCRAALDEREVDGICPDCLEALAELEAQQEEFERLHPEALPPGIVYVHAAYPYQGPVRTLIHQLKYKSVRAAAVPLAQAMALLPGGEEEILVPVPTSKRRQRRRGYNQSFLLCAEISRILGMQMIDALERTQERASQTRLSGEARRTNLVGCMRAKADVRGRRVLLIDDVYTTGATVTEAARALLEAGAQSVGVFIAASTSMPTPQKPTRLPF